VGYFANGTEGEMFEQQWCSRCVHSDWRPGKEFGDADNPPCPVWLAHSLHSYHLCNSPDDPGKQILDMLIPIKLVTAKDGIEVPVNECAMFCARDRGAEIPGQTSLEVGA
jgi:hypothetical protein